MFLLDLFPSSASSVVIPYDFGTKELIRVEKQHFWPKRAVVFVFFFACNCLERMRFVLLMRSRVDL